MSDFPPTEPTSLTQTIPSYLYEEYADDDDLQAFVRAYNEMAQEYVDWFNSIGLPIYTGDPIAGDLLDWVAEGLYGMIRPALGSGRNRDLGPLNTFAMNTIPFNQRRIIGPSDVTATSDDVFKRIITWAFFKGDGKNFSIRWLKRRVMRFLYGTNGTNFNVEATYQISITFGVGNQVNINLIVGVRTVTGGALFNTFVLNGMAFNTLLSTFTPLAPLPNTKVFKEAVDSGALELPFQFNYVVNVR